LHLNSPALNESPHIKHQSTLRFFLSDVGHQNSLVRLQVEFGWKQKSFSHSQQNIGFCIFLHFHQWNCGLGDKHHQLRSLSSLFFSWIFFIPDVDQIESDFSQNQLHLLRLLDTRCIYNLLQNMADQPILFHDYHV